MCSRARTISRINLGHSTHWYISSNNPGVTRYNFQLKRSGSYEYVCDSSLTVERDYNRFNHSCRQKRVTLNLFLFRYLFFNIKRIKSYSAVWQSIMYSFRFVWKILHLNCGKKYFWNCFSLVQTSKERMKMEWDWNWNFWV